MEKVPLRFLCAVCSASPPPQYQGRLADTRPVKALPIPAAGQCSPPSAHAPRAGVAGGRPSGCPWGQRCPSVPALRRPPGAAPTLRRGAVAPDSPCAELRGEPCVAGLPQPLWLQWRTSLCWSPPPVRRGPSAVCVLPARAVPVPLPLPSPALSAWLCVVHYPFKLRLVLQVQLLPPPSSPPPQNK